MKRRSLAFTVDDLPRLTKSGARARVQLGKPIEPAPVVLVRIDGGKAKKRSKYNNNKVTFEGMTFDSGHELKRWQQLTLMQRAGEIRNLQRQVWFDLAPSVDLKEKRRKRALRYKADFVYELVPSGEKVVEDAKGKITAEYRTKKHLMMSVHGILIREV